MSINSDYSNYNTNITGGPSAFEELRIQLTSLDFKIRAARAAGREDQVTSLEKQKGALINNYGLDKYLSEIDDKISTFERQKDMAEAALRNSTTSPEMRQNLQSFLMMADETIKMMSKEKEEAIRLVGLVAPIEQPSANYTEIRAQLRNLDTKIRLAENEDEIATLERQKGTLIKEYGLYKYLSELDADISMIEKSKTLAQADGLEKIVKGCNLYIEVLSKEKADAIRLVGLVAPVEQPSTNSETSSAQAQESTSSTRSSARRLRNSGMRI